MEADWSKEGASFSLVPRAVTRCPNKGKWIPIDRHPRDGRYISGSSVPAFVIRSTMNFKQQKEEEEPMQTEETDLFSARVAPRERSIGRRVGSTIWSLGRTRHPPRAFQETDRHPSVPSGVDSSQSTHRRGGRKTRQTGAHRFSRSSIHTAQLRNCSEGRHRVRFWYIGRRLQTSSRRHRVDSAIGVRSGQESLCVRH